MSASELIEGVVRLEATRLYSWSREYVTPTVASLATHEALIQLLFSAATGCATSDGPPAFLAKSVHAQLVASVHGDTFYVPTSAYRTVPPHSADELWELCLVFGLIESACGDSRLSLGNLYSLMHHLRISRLSLAGPDQAAGEHSALTIGRKVELFLLDTIDRILHVRGDLYDAAQAFAGREQARALQWITRMPSQRSM